MSVQAGPAPEGARPVLMDAVLSLGTGREEFTVEVRGGRAEVLPGRPSAAVSRINTDPATMRALLGGASGIEAFLSGRLRVRGNLAVAIQLDTAMGRPSKRRRWLRASRARAAGVDTFVLEAGRGRPVLLLHGLGATNASMLSTFWDLAADHHVIAPDLPGHGDSGKPVRSYHAGFYARWARDLLDALGIERAALVGNSMGGRIAVEAAFRHPGRVDRIALLAAAPAFLRHRQWAAIVRLLRPEMAAVPLFIPHSRVVGTVRRMFARPGRLPSEWFEAAADEFLRVFNSPRGRIAFFSALREVYLDEPYGDHGFWERLPRLERPALFIWGERDWLVPPSFAKHVSRMLPAAESVILRDCGHVPQFEQPALTHRLVRRFLNASEAADAAG